LGAVLAWRQYDDGKQKELNEVRTRVVLASMLFDTYFGGQLTALNTMANAPAVQNSDTAAMAAYFARMQPRDENLRLFNAGLGWIDREGVSRVSATDPHGSGGNASHRDYFKQVMATGKPYVSDGLTTKLGKKRVVVLAVPTRNAQG